MRVLQCKKYQIGEGFSISLKLTQTRLAAYSSKNLHIVKESVKQGPRLWSLMVLVNYFEPKFIEN